MRRLGWAFGVRGQAALVVVLFLSSLAVLTANSIQAVFGPLFEARDRAQARLASRALADAGLGVTRDVDGRPPSAAPEPRSGREGDRDRRESARDDRREDPRGRLDDPRARLLEDAAERVLFAYPGTEGGFFLADRADQFVAYAFPTRRPQPPPAPASPPDHGRPPSPPPPERVRQPHRPTGPGGPPGLFRRRDPPPLEEPYIRLQARQTADSDPDQEPIVQILDIGPSRVVVSTAAVGAARPARLVAWTLTRLNGPEQQRDEIRRYQVSTGLSLLSIVLALVLAGTLARTAGRERRTQEKLRDELRRSENLASLGRLLAGVAHEVRTPLAGIRSTVQLWQRLPDRAHNPGSQEAIIRAVDRLNALVARLLYFARAGHEPRSAVDLNAVVGQTLDLMRAQSEAQGIRVVTQLAPDLPAVPGSSQALSQVVLNLAGNAVQAMPAGGTLGCTTRQHRDGVELIVSDTGPGVLPEHRGRLFEPFFTTRAEGTGLGLALCREIVRQHGGEIGLVDRPPPGAWFRVILPAGATDAVAPRDVHQLPGAAP